MRPVGDPVFQSVSQALHVSYLVCHMPPTVRVSTQVLIDGLREQLGRTEARIASTINRDGLSQLEFRGQCALVTAAARDHLPPPEYAAVLARYAHHVAKAAGVRGLAEYIQPRTGVDHEWAVRGVVWSVYHRGSQRAADRMSLRSISSETGVSLHALRRCVDVVRQTGDALQIRAEDRLGQMFERTGLVAAVERHGAAA